MTSQDIQELVEVMDRMTKDFQTFAALLGKIELCL